jgi:hypothetical protein
VTKISKQSSLAVFHRITVGLKGGILRVASVAEVAAWLRLLVSGAPGCGRVCPALGGLLAVGSCWRGCLAVRLPAVALGAGPVQELQPRTRNPSALQGRHYGAGRCRGSMDHMINH